MFKFKLMLIIALFSGPVWALKTDCNVINGAAKIGLDVHKAKDILKVGAVVKTPGGMTLEVKKVILDGHKGMVYKVQSLKGNVYALKVPRYDLPDFDYDVKESFRKEVLKEALYEKLHVPYAQIVEHGQDYLVKDWVEGVRGDAWIAKWKKKNRTEQKKDPIYLKLMSLFEGIAAQGAYVGNLKSINLIYSDVANKWIVVDSSTPKLHYADANEIRESYRRTFENRWLRD